MGEARLRILKQYLTPACSPVTSTAVSLAPGAGEIVVQPSSSCRCSSNPVTGSLASHVAVDDELDPESELDPPPNGIAAGPDLSTDAIERGSPFGSRPSRPLRDLLFGAGSLYSLGGSHVMAIDVVESAEASGSYGGQTTLGTVSVLLESAPLEPLEPPEDDDPSEDVLPSAAGTSTHSRGVYRELDSPDVAMMR